MATRNGYLDVSSAPDFDLELDGYVEAFESAARTRTVNLSDFLPPAAHPKYHSVLRELIRAELEFRWERGDSPRVEQYRDRFPTLFGQPDWVREVAGEEFRLRQAAGDSPDPAEYRDRLGIDLFDDRPATQVISVTPAAGWPDDRTPGVGDVIPPGLALEEELGAGAFGRVYLARQADLAGRPVAVKLSAKLVGESQTLARLQHTNIVPVYSVHRVGRYHALVMPYLGRATLADLLRTTAGGRPTSGRAVVSTLAAHATAATSAGTSHAPARPVGLSPAALDRLARSTFTDAVLWIGAELADGLAHAHERGILHRDIKPANVLLTDDGRPMLLDFNLAADANAPSAGRDIGGTMRYMAPEQLAGLRLDRGVYSAQSDVYALGLVLAELLGGRLPFDDPTPGTDTLDGMVDVRSRPLNAAVLPAGTPPAVASILAKCLAPDPAARYASAADLREDLQRQLTHRPLKFAPNTSFRERLRKWAKRHPRLSSASTLGLLAFGVLAALVAVFLIRQGQLETLEALRARDDLSAAVGRVYSATGPATEAREVRAAVTTALAPYRTDSPGWTDGPLLRRLSETDRAAARQDAAVAMALTAELTDREARTERDSTRRTQLETEAKGWRERAAQTADRSGGESALDALHGKRLVAKAEQLRTLARDGEPRLATWMTLGAVESRLGRHAAAADAFTAASGMNPRLPWPYFHRGVARIEARQFADAEADFDRYLELRPDDPDGHFNRGLARQERKDAKGAVADFDAAERLGFAANRLYALRAQAKRASGDPAGADADDKTAAGIEPNDPRSFAVRGDLKRQAGDGKGALADYDAALALDPDFLPALRNRVAVLSADPDRIPDAVTTVDRILALLPESADDRAGRAVLLARLGKKADARADAAIAANSDSPLTLYMAASAELLAADAPADTARGLALLRKALRKDPAWAKDMPADPDLKRLHADPAFRELVAAAGVLARDK